MLNPRLAARVGVALCGRGKPGSGNASQGAMMPITSVFTAPELFWYSEWSRITWLRLIGMPSNGYAPPAG